MKIYNETWSIKEVSQEKMQEISGKKDYEYYGVCRDEENVIYILKSLGKVRKRKVLLHEVAHAISSVMGCYDAHDKYTEEDICDFAAAHIDEINRIVKEYLK
jgi:Zn-dependent peptidase ImmA (M78 family)